MRTNASVVPSQTRAVVLSSPPRPRQSTSEQIKPPGGADDEQAPSSSYQEQKRRGSNRRAVYSPGSRTRGTALPEGEAGPPSGKMASSSTSTRAQNQFSSPSPPVGGGGSGPTTAGSSTAGGATSSSSLSKQKWDKMISRGLTRQFLQDNKETFLRRVRRGIPPEYRWTVWRAVINDGDTIFGGSPGNGNSPKNSTSVGAVDPDRDGAAMNNTGGTSTNHRASNGTTSSNKTNFSTGLNKSGTTTTTTPSSASSSMQSVQCRSSTYQNLVAKDNKWISLIKIDISRTFPETTAFDDSHQNKLLRILSAYSNFNLDVGYCQGMNFIAGLLLLVSGSHEEETFWMFVSLMELRGLKGFYKDKFPMLRVYLKAFDRLLEEELPELRKHFRQEGVQPAVYLHQWFLTLYINCLPLQTVLVIWDVVVCEGLHVLLSITLSLLKVLQSVLLKLEFEDIVKFFKTMKTGDEDCDATMIGQLLIRQSARIELSQKVLTIINQESSGNDNFTDFDDFFGGGNEASGAPAGNETGDAELSWFEKMGKDLATFFEQPSEQKPAATSGTATASGPP
ncbi:unnamed protein product [Amoebophrya sp. A120]|nr:unnamed protein product [Amoebophrya sp. A120]|eukprot:GSA120T00012659001.1